jgi:raffinose/stachyose/melibiose transport system permease protein
MKSVVLPLMIPSFTVSLFLTIKGAFMVYDTNLTLTNGGPYASTQLLAMHVYNKAFLSQQFGVGQAEAFVLFVIVAVITFTQVYISKKMEVEA